MTEPTATPGPETDPSCLFCRIVAGEVPSRQIYTDEHAVAFLDIGAWHRGHSLVVPRRHVPDLVTVVPRYADEPGLARLVSHHPVPDGELDSVHAQVTAGP